MIQLNILLLFVAFYKFLHGKKGDKYDQMRLMTSYLVTMAAD